MVAGHQLNALPSILSPSQNRILQSQPVFEGKPEEDVTNWIERAETALTVAQIPAGEWPLHLVSLMGGLAQDFTLAFLRLNPHVDFFTLVDTLSAQFAHPNEPLRTRARLRDLKQDGQIGPYIQRFQQLISRVKTASEDDKISYFVEGLVPVVKNAIYRERPNTLALAYQIAQCWGDDYTPSSAVVKEPEYPPGVPMDLSASHHYYKNKSSRGEKPRCHRCGQEGHVAIGCRNMPSRQERHAMNMMSKTSNDNSLADDNGLIFNHASHLSTDIELPVIELRWRGRNVNALVDSGATVCLIPAHLAVAMNAPIEDCSPFTLSFANGGSQQITKKTRIPITVEDRKEDLDVFLYNVESKKPSFDMILGDTWLRLANPVIDWRARKMTIGTRVFEFKNQRAKRESVLGMHVGHSALAVSIIENEIEVERSEGKDPVVPGKEEPIMPKIMNRNEIVVNKLELKQHELKKVKVNVNVNSVEQVEPAETNEKHNTRKEIRILITKKRGARYKPLSDLRNQVLDLRPPTIRITQNSLFNVLHLSGEGC